MNKAGMTIELLAEWEGDGFSVTNFDDEIRKRMESIGFTFHPHINQKATVATITLH